MKRINLVLLGMIICAAAFAQKKPKIRKVEGYLKDGEIAEAKSIVDAGIEHEKTKDDDQTWFMRALTYVALDTTEAYQGMAENPMQKALEAFEKASELAGGKDPFLTNENGLPVTMTQYQDQYYAYYFNKGAKAFGTNEYDAALQAFEASQKINPTDTNAFINAAYAAQNAENMDAAVSNYSEAVEQGAKEKDLFSLWSYLLMQQDKNEKALEVVRKAREIYPEDAELAKNEINLLIKMDKVEEATNNILDAVKAEPENADLRFTLGVMYDEMGKTEKAMEAYQSALEIDPNHYNSNYNLGVLLINEAQEVIKERNSLGMSKADQKKAQELKPKIQEALKDALPQWEKLQELKAQDQTTLETLQYLYTQLGMKEEAKAVNDKLQSMN